MAVPKWRTVGRLNTFLWIKNMPSDYSAVLLGWITKSVVSVEMKFKTRKGFAKKGEITSDIVACILTSRICIENVHVTCQRSLHFYLEYITLNMRTAPIYSEPKLRNRWLKLLFLRNKPLTNLYINCRVYVF